MLLIGIVFVALHAAIAYNIRVARIQLIYDSKYTAGYHLHTIGTFSMDTLTDCLYLCQNNDYCRTANYFATNEGTMCSLFEENSFVGQIVPTTSTMSIVISFNLCPNDIQEPAYLCFGVPMESQAPVTVQYAMNNLRLTKMWPIEIYYPIIFPTLIYIPSFQSGGVQIFEWPSLNFVTNLTFPLPIYSFDMDLSGSFLLTSTSNYSMYYYSSSKNWTDSSTKLYPAFLSDDYIVSFTNGNTIMYVYNRTTGQRMYNLTSTFSQKWWARIVNQQAYITTTTGIKRLNLSQGPSAPTVTLVPSLVCKEVFLDASGRLYVEQFDPTKNNSFIYDLSGNLLASYTNGNKIIGKASKYTFYLLNNFKNSLLFNQYP